MSKRVYVCMVFLVCLCMVLSFSTASADTGVEVLIYTGKVAVTASENITTTYTMPQELTAIPADSAMECLDGVAILKIGEVQVILEAGDKVQLSLQNDTNKVDIACLSGEIEAIWGEDTFKIAHGQGLALNSQGTPIIETAENVDAPVNPNPVPRAKLAAPPLDLIPDPPGGLPHASPFF